MKNWQPLVGKLSCFWFIEKKKYNSSECAHKTEMTAFLAFLKERLRGGRGGWEVGAGVRGAYRIGGFEFNFKCSLQAKGERKSIQMVLVTWPNWPPGAYKFETFKNLLQNQ